jgi:hypothetical protein
MEFPHIYAGLVLEKLFAEKSDLDAENSKRHSYIMLDKEIRIIYGDPLYLQIPTLPEHRTTNSTCQALRLPSVHLQSLS